MFPYRHAITTRWDDNDVYGHVNNVRHFAFLIAAIARSSPSLRTSPSQRAFAAPTPCSALIVPPRAAATRSTDHPFVPHGHSVIVTAPVAFRFTYVAAPARHHHVAGLLAGAQLDDPGPDSLPDVLRALMRDVGAPSGIAEPGYGEDDVPALAEGALKQERLLAIAPREPGPADLGRILTASLRNW